MANVATQTLALAVGAGCLISLFCDRLKVSATLPLIAAGFALGPYGAKVIDASSLGDSLSAMISVIIGLLIFEGGLHLNRKELSHAPRALAGLLTVGVALTYAGVAAAAHYVVGLSWPTSLVLGGMLVVTGPTVIQPMLKRLPLTPPLHAALAGEGILIDPIGVIIAATTVELVAAHYTGGMVGPTADSLMHVFKPFAVGTGVGVALGLAARWLIELISRKQRIGADLVHMLAMGTCMVSVGAGEAFAPEAGLVAAALCSVIMANTKMLGISEMREFKQRLASIFVAMLFILLSSRLDLRELVKVPPAMWVFVGSLIVVVRPLSAVVSTIGSKLEFRERMFISLFAPRGIVAASLGSLLAAQLAGPIAAQLADPEAQADLIAEAKLLEQLVFMAVIGTIAWAAITGPTLARLLGVRVPSREGVVLVGAGALAQKIGAILLARGVPVHLVDRNRQRVEAARADGVEASAADATDARWMDDNINRPELGWLLPMTGNPDVDMIAARWAEERFGKDRVLWPRPLIEGPAEMTIDMNAINAGEIGQLQVAEGPAGTPADVALFSMDERGRVGPAEWAVSKPGRTVVYLRKPGWAKENGDRRAGEGDRRRSR